VIDFYGPCDVGGDAALSGHVSTIAYRRFCGGRILRTIGIVRVRLKIGVQNLVYNIRRLATLERMADA